MSLTWKPSAWAVPALAVALYGASQSLASAQPVPDAPMFPALTAAAAAAIAIEGPRYSLTLERVGDGWVATNHGSYPVLPAPVDAIIASLQTMVAHEIVTEDPTRYGLLDLEGPGTGTEDIHVLVADTNDTALVDAIIGTPAAIMDPPPRSGIHVRNVNDAAAWLVAGGFGMPTRLSGWFAPLLQIRGPDVASISIYQGETLMFEASKVDFATGTYGLTALNEEVAPLDRAFLDIDGIRSLAQAVVSVTADDIQSRDAFTVPADTRIINFVTQTGLTVTLTLLEADDGIWFAIDAAGEGPEATAAAEAIRARTTDWAFKLPEFNTTTLGRAVGELIFVTMGPGDF